MSYKKEHKINIELIVQNANNAWIQEYGLYTISTISTFAQCILLRLISPQQVHFPPQFCKFWSLHQ